MTSANGSGNRNRMTFQNCRQFSGVSVLRFDEPSAPAAAAPQRAVTPVSLPDAFEVEIRLLTQIDSATAAVGDPVRAAVRQSIKLGRDVAVPKGAEVSCRIAVLEKRGTFYLMTLEPSSIDFDGGHADLTGRENKVVMMVQRNGYFTNPNSVFRRGPQVIPMDRIRLAPGAGFILRSRLLKSKDNDSIRP
jgi:hypothetical protein